MTLRRIYTIGHSTHALPWFIELLQRHRVNCLIDVRSIAASGYNPQFNKEPLKQALKTEGITYLHFGKEFGARQSDPLLLDNEGRVDFEKVRAGETFRSGIERLKTGIGKGYIMALTCAEAEPLSCHRFSMITPGLKEAGFEVWHILKNGSLQSTEALEDQLLLLYRKKMPKPSLYAADLTREEKLKLAYKMKNLEAGYKF